VDFKKAYNYVCWNYLDAVIGKMMFPTLWRKWIEECIGMVPDLVLVNVSRLRNFIWREG